MNPFLLVLVGYLLGSLPTSYLVSRWGYGVDLSRRGSGNFGATNVFRVLGWKAALPVVVVDMGKGWLPAWFLPRVDASPDGSWILVYGAAAILGHVYPVWMRFRGGKGVATSAGVLLAAAPIAAFVGLGVWLLAVLSTRIVSVASIAGAIAVSVTIWVRPPATGSVALGIFAAALTVFVLWSHRSNLRRLLRGEENRFGTDSRAGDPPASETAPPARRGSEPGKGAR